MVTPDFLRPRVVVRSQTILWNSPLTIYGAGTVLLSEKRRRRKTMIVETLIPVLLYLSAFEDRGAINNCRNSNTQALSMMLVAGAFRQAPGPIHGPDPHDEVHDYGLPANKEAGNGYPSDDPYNDSTSNNRNYPYRPY